MNIENNSITDVKKSFENFINPLINNNTKINIMQSSKAKDGVTTKEFKISYSTDTKFFDIIDAVNKLNDDIIIAKKQNLSIFKDIDIMCYSKDEYKVTIYGTDSITGRFYTSLELLVKNGEVYWENMPVGKAKDLLPNSILLHNSTNNGTYSN